MAFPLFGGQKQNETLALLVDIGSASVGAALVVNRNGYAPRVLASERENIRFQEVLSSSRVLIALNNALGAVLKTLDEKVKKTIGGIPVNVFCTLSSPWFIIKVREISIIRSEKFEVTERFLSEVMDDEIIKIKNEFKKTLPSEDIQIIEKKIIHVKLNGYEVANPYNQTTANISIIATIGVSSKKLIHGIERKIKGVINAKSFYYSVFPIAAYSAIRDIFSNENDFLFLDITGEATDVSCIMNNLFDGTVLFPRGRNFFIREISTRLHTVHEEADTLFSMFLRNELDDARSTQFAGVVEQLGNEWLTSFQKSLDDLIKRGITPRKIFFTSDADISPLFSSLIKKAKFDSLDDTPFDVQYLDKLIVSKFVSFDDGVIRDPFIVVDALFAEKIFKQHIQK